jgi:CheY-like chemotaxis protein
MLVINSLDATQELSNLDGSRMPEGVPVVVCSVAEIVDGMDSLGISGSLVKPISQEQLLEAVNRFSEPDSTILIVDDEAEALRLFRRMIAGDEIKRRVLVAQNGQEALEMLKSQGVDLILLDLVMPQMDGFQLLKLLQEDLAYAQIPVILISAKDPTGHPVVSSLVAITIAGGLSMQRLLDCFQALGQVFSSAGPPVDRTQGEATDG